MRLNLVTFNIIINSNKMKWRKNETIKECNVN